MLYLNNVKQNRTSVLCFTTHVIQNANNAECFFESCYTQNKTIKAFSFNQSKHSALSAMCYLNQVKHCKTSAMFYLHSFFLKSRCSLKK